MSDEASSGTPKPETASALPEAEITRLTDEIVTALKTVYDPEIPADIYELGLIYKIDIADDRSVKVDMTLTTPNCPSAQELPRWSKTRCRALPASARSMSRWSGIRRGTRAG